ncbi:hypothetical protein NHQ30_000033 [Ciborinia camelliae]|nr:hypothetical protein NHQ30_000033 [Ciborinia camelliae]
MAAQSTSSSASNTFSSSPSSTPINYGRGGYNGPNKNDEDEDSFRPIMSSGSLRLRGGDDDEEEDGRGGYN